MEKKYVVTDNMNTVIVSDVTLKMALLTIQACCSIDEPADYTIKEWKERTEKCGQ